MSDLVGNPDSWFSHVKAHLLSERKGFKGNKWAAS